MACFRPILLAIIVLSLSGATGCFITNAAGTQPSRSYKGEELRLLVARNMAAGWMLGGEQYIDSKKGFLAEGDSFIPLIEYRDFPEWFNTAFLMSYSSTSLKTRRFYREKPADECLNIIQVSASILSRAYLDEAQSARTVTTSGGNSIDMNFVRDSDFQAAILLTQPALDFCDFELTGELIESKDYSF